MNDARVRTADLRFHLFDRSVHPELFPVLRRADLSLGRLRATLVISGQSHVISVRTTGETITEVVAPPDASLPRIGSRTALQLARAAREEIRREDGQVRYGCSLRVDTYAPEEYRRAAARLLEEDRLERLKAFFEQTPDGRSSESLPGELTPFALMDFASCGESLEVSSVHACPHELAVVRVDSRFAAG